MKSGIPLVSLSALALLLGIASAAPAQVASHVLPPDWTLPVWPSEVDDLPQVSTTELSAPLVREKAAAKESSIPTVDPLAKPAEGDPQATTLEKMLPEPKKAIDLARDGKFAEAVEAGRPLIERPKDAWADFTWDYLASAVAWSYIQLGQAQQAADVHREAANRFDDEDLKKFHRLLTRTISEVVDGKATDEAGKPVTVEQLKESETLKRLARATLADDIKQFNRHLEILGKAGSCTTRLSNARLAYERLRYVRAVDPEIAEQLEATYRTAIDTLITDAAQKAYDQSAEQHRRVAKAAEAPMRYKDMKAWNTEVQNLWSKICEVKRLCRVHDYLRRLGLAGSADANAMFQCAHKLLFAPGSQTDVFRPVGGTTLFYSRGDTKLGGRDMRRKAPFEEVFGQ